MNTIPTYQQSNLVPMRGTTVKISAIQSAYLDRILKATQSPNVPSAVRLLLSAEGTAVKEGKRNPKDFIPTRSPKPCSLSFKLSEDDKVILSNLRFFYGVRYDSDIIGHLLNQVIVQLDEQEGR